MHPVFTLVSGSLSIGWLCKAVRQSFFGLLPLECGCREIHRSSWVSNCRDRVSCSAKFDLDYVSFLSANCYKSSGLKNYYWDDLVLYCYYLL